MFSPILPDKSNGISLAILRMWKKDATKESIAPPYATFFVFHIHKKQEGLTKGPH
jgi:hypothetical protein